MRTEALETEAAAGLGLSQPWQRITQDPRQDKEQPHQSAYRHTDHYERTLTQQEGISGIPIIQRLKSSTHLNNINLLKNSNMQAQNAQGPQSILTSTS